jgi:lipoprotein signal peptidase
MPLPVLGASAFLADFFSKRAAEQRLEAGQEKVLPGGFIRLARVENKGSAGGLIPGSSHQIALLSAAGLAAAAVRSAVLSLKKAPKICRAGYALLLGGGFGNLNDRLLKGSVTDFIRIPSLPGKAGRSVFNLADVFIFTGTLIALVFEIAGIFSGSGRKGRRRTGRGFFRKTGSR